MGFCFSKCDYLLTRLSNLGGNGLPCDFNSLTDVRNVDFSVYPDFYLLGESDDFQTPYTTDQKPVSNKNHAGHLFKAAGRMLLRLLQYRTLHIT